MRLWRRPLFAPASRRENENPGLAAGALFSLAKSEKTKNRFSDRLRFFSAKAQRRNSI